ncbi:hypothetical protein QR685DRAFT_440876, partial [Neurospora intermedia]
LTKLELILRTLKRRNVAGENGNFIVRCYLAVAPLFWVGQGTYREWGGCGKGSPRI